jgi:hypothetical protein
MSNMPPAAFFERHSEPLDEADVLGAGLITNAMRTKRATVDGMVIRSSFPSGTRDRPPGVGFGSPGADDVLSCNGRALPGALRRPKVAVGCVTGSLQSGSRFVPCAGRMATDRF